MILVDSCILLDVLNDTEFAAASIAALNRAARRGALALNEIVYAEVAYAFEKRKELDDFLFRSGLILERCPAPSLFAASELWKMYRTRGGRRTQRILPDFIIAAHAVASEGLVTRDSFFRTVKGLTIM